MSGETSEPGDEDASAARAGASPATDTSTETGVTEPGGERPGDELGTERPGDERDDQRPGGERDPLTLQSLRIRRAPGFETEQLRVEDVASGVTVVHGPNASGKTTVARAIQWCCWPDAAPDGAEVVGEFALDGDDWRVRVDRGDASYQRAGRPADPPALPPTDQRDRYRLALHDLLQRDVRDETFADAIERESAGGYDLDAAGDALGFDVSTATRGIAEYGRVDSAVDAWREARGEMEDLEAERRQLPELESDLEDAREARRRADLLERAIEYARARDDLADARAEVEAFPDELAELDGDEAERVDQLAAEIEEWSDRRAEAEADLRDAEAALDSIGLPADGLPDGLLDGLRERVDRIDELERERDRLERERSDAEERRERARDDLPLDVDPAELSDLDPETWPDLWAFARAADRVEHERRLRETVDRWLGADGAGEPAGTDDAGGALDVDRSTLRQGRQALEGWLASPPDDVDDGDGGRRARLVGTAAAVALFAASLAIALLAGGSPLGLAIAALVALVGVGLAAYGWVASGGDDGADGRRRTYREEYERLDLAAPEDWSEPAVRDRLTDCYDAIAADRLDEQRAERRETLLEEVQALEEHRGELAERRAALRQTLGAAPGGTDLELVATAKALARWQACDAEVDGLDAELGTVRDQLEAARAECSAELDPYGYDPVDDAAGATECVHDLADRGARHEDAVAQRERARERIETAESEIGTIEDEREAVFATVDLEPDASDRLEDLCEQVPDYEDAVAAREEAEALAESRRADLRERPGHDPALEERDVADLREERESARASAEEYESIHGRVKEIEAEVENAKGHAAVETARADLDRALDDLEARFEADCAASVGDALLEHVREATVEADRPAVFDRARELLAQITRGRYELDLDADASTFRAYDAVKERGFALGELSSGTKLQVLLSVRLAFVERHERGVQVPLVLDEALANSDDERARVIVDAAVELARRGRQVWYFTAQGDEVAKWREALADESGGEGGSAEPESGVEYAEVDLADAQDLDDAVRVPDLDDVADAGRDVPDPAEHDCDHAAYGEALDVPAFDPRSGAGRAHCWYLLEDPDALADLLRLGIERWGQLRTLLESGLDDLVAGDPAVRERLERRGVALETYVECWLRGRGERVTRDALEATDAVTENFLEDVTELARSVDGDAEAILQGLRDGEVDLFRSDKIEELEAFFEAEGYLDPVEPLDPEDVRLRVVGTLVDRGLEREAAAEEADALLGQIEAAP